MKAYKFNRLFNPQISSTCPCVPRFHVSFGRPRLYEEISDQIDKGEFETNGNKEARKFQGRRDKFEIDESNQDVIIYDEYGIKVIYEESLNDMLEIEEELLKIGSYYIQQNEFVIDTDVKEPQGAVDRGEMALQLINKEWEFSFQKVLLIEQYLEAYEHTSDPLEQVRIVQMIADLMSQRPRLNLEGTYFQDSYQNEIDVLK